MLRAVGAMDLRSFPLAWRWTDEKYAVLPEACLSKISPLSIGEATEVFQASVCFLGKDGLNKKLFDVARISTAGKEPDAVRTWLVGFGVDDATDVTLSWQQDSAVTTPWGFFQITGVSSVTPDRMTYQFGLLLKTGCFSTTMKNFLSMGSVVPSDLNATGHRSSSLLVTTAA